ncbi:SMP-30/gluconolactonase/LRE family protein [Streptomyces sp. MK5]|uniref:SMP-30/gluconolactonase/LRE family protein n=1 Tax=Streptomyces sp. MK5 TaxID=3064253 RepID=UPI00274224EB|nr:SMP-30/gluconolactonase/LRE family protein [Streptomyces sp. MK5]
MSVPAHQPVGTFTPVTPDRLELGEGPRLLSDGSVVLVDILTGRLLRLPGDETGSLVELARLAQPLGAVAPLGAVGPGSRGWAAATGMAFAVLDEGGRIVRTIAVAPQAGGPQRMNDAVCDPAGRMWAGTMAYDATPGAGALHRWNTDGSVTCVLNGLTIPNGPVFSPDGRTLYLADSAAGTVEAFSVDPDTAGLSDRRPVFRVAPEDGSPDGMTVDSDGCIWSAIWGGSQIRRYSPQGQLLQTVDVPALQPTAVCLTGRHLVVTTASYGLADPGPWDGAVLRASCTATAPVTPSAAASPTEQRV